MNKTTLRVSRAAAAVAILGATMLTGMSTGSADPIPVTCDAFNGNGLSVTPVGANTYSWSVRGSGVCSGGFPENFDVSFTGSGTSQGNGLCSQDRTSVVLTVTATYSNSSRTFTKVLRWNVPIVIGVEAMPFLVSGDASGVGVASTRIFLKCTGTGGTDAARFVWEQTI